MQPIKLEINDLSVLFIEYPPTKHISKSLTDAYNIIFNKKLLYINELSPEELDFINKSILSCFELLKTLPEYNPDYEPEHDIIRMIRIAIAHWFYTQYKNKRVKNKLKQETYIWQVPQGNATQLRKKFKCRFGAKPEQLLAVCCFYLLPILTKSIKEQNLWNYGAIVSTIVETGFLIQYNAKQVAWGKEAHTEEKKLERACKQIQKEYHNIKNKPFDEKILYCQEHCNLNEDTAKTAINLVEKNYKK